MQTQIVEKVMAGTGTPSRSFSLAKKLEKIMPRSRANACVWRELAHRILREGVRGRHPGHWRHAHAMAANAMEATGKT